MQDSNIPPAAPASGSEEPTDEHERLHRQKVASTPTDTPETTGPTLDALLTAFGNATFDCGTYEDMPDDEDDARFKAEYPAKLAASKTARKAVVDFVESALASAQRDGERLDWLDRHPMAVPLVHDTRGWRTKQAHDLREVGPFPELREAIDAASRPSHAEPKHEPMPRTCQEALPK